MPELQRVVDGLARGVVGHAVLCPACGAASSIEDDAAIEVLAIIGE